MAPSMMYPGLLIGSHAMKAWSHWNAFSSKRGILCRENKLHLLKKHGKCLLSSVEGQAIIWSNAVILLIGPLGKNFFEIWPKLQQFSITKMNVKMSSTGNHYKWDWPKSQFCMPDDSVIVVWLRNIKVGNVYLFNFLHNTLKKSSFWKWEIRKLENVIFPSSAEPCRILQNSALVPQNSADHLGKNHEILRISAEFCGIPYNGFYSAELFCRTTKRNNILQKSAELSKSVLRNSAGVFGSAELFCGTLYY